MRGVTFHFKCQSVLISVRIKKKETQNSSEMHFLDNRKIWKIVKKQILIIFNKIIHYECQRKSQMEFGCKTIFIWESGEYGDTYIVRSDVLTDPPF